MTPEQCNSLVRKLYHIQKLSEHSNLKVHVDISTYMQDIYNILHNDILSNIKFLDKMHQEFKQFNPDELLKASNHLAKTLPSQVASFVALIFLNRRVFNLTEHREVIQKVHASRKFAQDEFEHTLCYMLKHYKLSESEATKILREII